MAFIEKRSEKQTLSFLSGLSWNCAKLGGPLSLQLHNLVLEKRYLEVIKFQFDYSWSFDTNDFLYARQIQALFSKQDFLDLGVDKKAAMFAKFMRSEEMCKQTNVRYENLASFSKDVSAIHFLASQKIADILGNAPTFAELDFKFGPGATTSTNFREASPRVKLSRRLECGSNLLPFVRELIEEIPWLAHCHHVKETEVSYTVPVTVAPGKLGEQPKNSLETRPCVTEPVLSALGQKAIGSEIRRRLSYGVRVPRIRKYNATTKKQFFVPRGGKEYKIPPLDLKNGQARNQQLARQGSIDGTLCTIDLVSASDCIARMCVWSHLPYDWACLLDVFRTSVVKFGSELIPLEKFSSMGNAYTFELESLLFYAFTLSTCEYLGLDVEGVSVYGDDIICPTAAYDLLSQVLVESGFEVNNKKSFKEGPFRESCGADYLNGIDIRPFYVKELLCDRTLYVMHNWFYRNFEFTLASFALKSTCKEIRIFGPDGYGDGHLIGDYSLRINRAVKRGQHDGGVFDTYKLGSVQFSGLERGDYIFPIYSIYVRGEPTWRDLFVAISEADMYRVRGQDGYSKISIYTLARSIFNKNVTVA